MVIMENNTTTTYEQSNSNLNLNHDNRNVYPPLYLGTDSSMAETFINISNKIQTNNNSQHSNKVSEKYIFFLNILNDNY